MKTIISKTAVILLLASLLISAVSCSSEKGGDTSVDAGNTAEEVQTEAETEDTYFKEVLVPKDFSGASYTMYLRSDVDTGDFVIEEEDGDIVDDAVYKRNLDVSERFNVVFKYNYDDTQNTTYETPGIQAIRAGDHANDILALHGAHVYHNALQGLFLDWNKNAKYNDFTAPYWDQGFVENNAFAGKLYGITGSITYTNIGGAFCIFFNKEICDNYGMKYPYQSVLDGKWTFDQYLEMSETATYDLNGDGRIEPSSDQLGLYSSTWRFPIGAFYMAGDRIITLDNEGVPELTAYNERTNVILERIKNYCTGDNVYLMDLNGQYDGNLFRQERALFLGAQVSNLEGYRDIEAEIGVIPYPKYDDTTESYYSLIDAGMSVFSLPITASNADLEMISTITEALAYEGHRDVIPAYFETALKTKYSRDNESEDMLQMIFESRYVDYGFFDATINWDLSYIGRSMLMVNKNFTSFYEGIRKSTERQLQSVYEEYLKLEY